MAKTTIKHLSPFVPTKIAFKDLDEPEQTFNDWSHTKYSRAKWMGKHCQGQVEVNLDSPGPTIRSEHHGNIEFRRLAKDHGGKIVSELKKGLKERRLSVRECARIQTFPDNYEFVIRNGKGFLLSSSDGYRLVGNAVPPLLGYHLAKRLEKIWPLMFNDT